MNDQGDTTCKECGNVLDECLCADSHDSDTRCEECGKVFEECECLDPGQLPDTTSDTVEEFQDSTQRIQANLDNGIDAVVDSKFRIIGELGSGSDSTVYLAEHLYLQKKVSLKLFKPVDFESNRFARIQREAVTLANIDHPNIVGVTDLGLMGGNGYPYIVQEYIEGKDFQSLIKDKGALSEERAIRLFCQIASGITFLHECGIIHRDIKPSNIIISPGSRGRETAKLIDLGIAKPDNPGGALSFCTTSGSIFGSPFYMSPEQCKGESIDYRSDIYSFGCVMYEALTGNPPFRGQTMLVTLEKHIGEEAAAINPRRKQIDPVSSQLEALIRKCLSKDPKDRFTDMTAVYRELISLRTKRKRLIKVALIALCSLIFLGCSTYLVRMQSAPVQASKKKNDALKIVDKLSQAYIYYWTTADEDCEKSFRDAMQEAVRENAPPLTRLQIGCELFHFLFLTKNVPAQNALFNELQVPLKEVEKKIEREPETLRGKSLDCLHRIYFFAGDAAFRDKTIGKYVAVERLKTALKYALLCDEERGYPSFAKDMIKSTLAAVYFSSDKMDEAERLAMESTEGLSKQPTHNTRALFNNYVVLTQILVAKKNFEKAHEMLNSALQFRQTTGVRAHDKELAVLSEEIKRARGEEPGKKVVPGR